MQNCMNVTEGRRRGSGIETCGKENRVRKIRRAWLDGPAVAHIMAIIGVCKKRGALAELE